MANKFANISHLLIHFYDKQQSCCTQIKSYTVITNRSFTTTTQKNRWFSDKVIDTEPNNKNLDNESKMNSEQDRTYEQQRHSTLYILDREI